MKNELKKESDAFWRGLVYTKKGVLNERKVLKELSDFYFLMHQVPEVYCAVTGGLLSKTNYYASTVIQAYQDALQDDIDNAIEEYKENLAEAERER